MQIANPIYDTVFKYLMEDERIARTILSALLRCDIESVKARPHEYSNVQRDTLSVFRIDFAATLVKPGGERQTVLIELQKTWLETETLRFRQYLGVQYSNPENMRQGDDADGTALPMVAVYLLGHRVGDIEEPVLYVRHHAYDYEDRPVTRGLPNAFVDSLTHDSIIVQIPLLHGLVNTRLYEVLSIFDQTRKSEYDQQLLNVDDSAYSGNDDMEHIVRRLLAAASDARMRREMQVEDEFFSIIEKRDTEILMRDKELALKQVQLDEKQYQLDEKQYQLDEKQSQLDEKQSQLDEQKSMLKASVDMLLKAGVPSADIARQLGCDLRVIEELQA